MPEKEKNRSARITAFEFAWFFFSAVFFYAILILVIPTSRFAYDPYSVTGKRAVLFLSFLSDGLEASRFHWWLSLLLAFSALVVAARGILLLVLAPFFSLRRMLALTAADWLFLWTGLAWNMMVHDFSDSNAELFIFPLKMWLFLGTALMLFFSFLYHVGWWEERRYLPFDDRTKAAGVWLIVWAAFFAGLAGVQCVLLTVSPDKTVEHFTVTVLLVALSWGVFQGYFSTYRELRKVTGRGEAFWLVVVSRGAWWGWFFFLLVFVYLLGDLEWAAV